MIDRRTFLAAPILLAGCAGLGPQRPERDHPLLAQLRTRLGPDARLGIAALDTGSGKGLRFDAESLYPLCSTFKVPLAAAILAQVDQGRLRLAEEIPFGEADLLGHAPVIRANIARGRLSIETLCAAIVEVSDNSAANLLLRRLGGPAALTDRIRRWGDRSTRLDRYEEALNSNLPGDPRDTTTPAAMVGLLRTLLLGSALRPESRGRLAAWMVGATTGLKRLRAGLPANWRVGDKTGNGANGAANDIAIAWPPQRPPILIASYISGAEVEAESLHAAHAAVGRIVAGSFA